MENSGRENFSLLDVSITMMTYCKFDALIGGAKDGKEFQFPAFYHLPPFFTLQPHAAVRAKQLELWKQLISEYLDLKEKGMVGIG